MVASWLGGWVLKRTGHRSAPGPPTNWDGGRADVEAGRTGG